ncbi:MAG: hypothetical protein IKP77_04445 [Acholeplasmatales bacterium]|nr:hypothetical protein [Acholeplasmatales bacterium]
MKIKPKAVKVYKPEIMVCPKCGNNLKYVYTVSNRGVQFSSGKVFRIKNMGYKCPKCNDYLYFSLTALKLAFKGYTYSAKVCCMIDYYKCKGYTRDRICDILADSDIEISDRNIDIIGNKVKSYVDCDYDKAILDAYRDMNDKFGEIRVCFDLVTIDKCLYFIYYSYFSGDILAIWKTDSADSEFIKEIIKKYINSNYNITTILTIRPQFRFYSVLKENIPSNVKLMSYSKF